MSRRLYASNAERQRAYRERLRLEQGRAGTVAPAAVATRVPSRPARLRAIEADVRRLAAEYQLWLARLPPSLAEGQAAAQLEEVIAQLEEAAELLEAIQPPAVGQRARAGR